MTKSIGIEGGVSQMGKHNSNGVDETTRINRLTTVSRVYISLYPEGESFGTNRNIL